MTYMGFLHVLDVVLFAVTIACLCGTAYELRKGRRLRRAGEERLRAHEEYMTKSRARSEKTK